MRCLKCYFAFIWILGLTQYVKTWELIWLTVEAENCPGSEITDSSPMQITELAIFEVDKETMIANGNIYFGSREMHKLFRRGKQSVVWHLEQPLFSNEASLFISVARKDSDRINDNPTSHITFGGVTRTVTAGLTATGTGLDFSNMYLHDPFRPSRITFTVQSSNGTMTEYFTWNAPQNCYAAGTWIANEGSYFLDIKANQWIAIYFDYDYYFDYVI